MLFSRRAKGVRCPGPSLVHVGVTDGPLCHVEDAFRRAPDPLDSVLGAE